MFLPFLITIQSMSATFLSQVKDCLPFISSVVWNAFLEMQEKHLSMLSFPATSGGLGTNCQKSMVWCAVHSTWCRWCGSSKLQCLCCWDILSRDCRGLFVLPRQWRNKISMLECKSFRLDELLLSSDSNMAIQG